MGLKSFRDPTTNVLKAWGYLMQNQPGDVAQDEAETFNLTPGQWQWDGAQWQPFTPPPLTNAQKQALAQTNLDANTLLKAVVIWVATKQNIPLAQARSEIAAIYQTLV
jgi:hypothetical protein